MIEDRLRTWFQRRTPGGIVAANLFGSVAAGRAHRESDVDVAVLLDRTLYPDVSARGEAQIVLANELIDATRQNDVDVVILNEAPPELARRIVVEGIMLHARDADEVRAYERDVQLMAADLVPWLRRMRRIKLDALA